MGAHTISISDNRQKQICYTSRCITESQHMWFCCSIHGEIYFKKMICYIFIAARISMYVVRVFSCIICIGTGTQDIILWRMYPNQRLGNGRWRNCHHCSSPFLHYRINRRIMWNILLHLFLPCVITAKLVRYSLYFTWTETRCLDTYRWWKILFLRWKQRKKLRIRPHAIYILFCFQFQLDTGHNVK